MTTPLRVLAAALVAAVVLTALAVQVRTSEAPAARSYVGQQSCMSSNCHAGAYSDTSDYQGAAAFRQTLHQKIHLRPTPETVVIEKYFAGDSVLRFQVGRIPVPGKDIMEIHLSKTGADYFIQMRFGDGGDSTPRMKVAYTYGGYGWIQRYLIEINGSFYVAPFQYVLPAYKERSDTSRAFYFLDLVRWFAVDQSSGEGRFFEFTSNQFRSQSWDKDCSFCHVNGFSLARRISGSDTSYFAGWAGRDEDSATQDQNILIGCESCHGPGSEHVANPTRQNIFSPGELPMTREATDIKLDLCNSCHTRVRSTAGTYRYPYDEAADRPWMPGERIEPYYRHPFNDAQFWPDRVTSYAHHQSGQDFWRGLPYEKHVFANGCWDCHVVHREGPNGLPYQLKKNYYSTADGEGCLECHGSAAAAFNPPMENMALTAVRNGRVVNAHTQHEAASSACVFCHFTKAATISFIDLPRKPGYEFSQHDFRVVRPTATREYRNDLTIGMMNTCAAGCHRNGRGSRNTPDSMPAAPSFGIVDQNLGTWKENTDVELADSLWYHYQRMYSKYLGAVRDGESSGAVFAIVSIAPNPSQGPVTIRFAVPERADIRLDVYDPRGRLVRTIAAGPHARGTFTATWRGDDERGAIVSAGRYFVRLKAGERVVSTAIELVR
jgi:hypothetical protein